MGWSEVVTIHTIQECEFYVEVEFEEPKTHGRMSAIFVYASIWDRIRDIQWQELVNRSSKWGDNWILGGDFNDIREPGEKKRGRHRSEASCQSFRDFIANMHMEEMTFQGKTWTWANN